jgi:hypothetical protein
MDQPDSTVAAAVRYLEGVLGLTAEDIEVLSAQEVNWIKACPDADADVSCPTEMVPGYLMTVEAGTEICSVYSDLERANLRHVCSVPADESGEERPALGAAILYLAGELGLFPQEIRVVRMEDVEWSDSCLEIPRPDALCAAALTPGYRVVLLAGTQEYEVRTDTSGINVSLAP